VDINKRRKGIARHIVESYIDESKNLGISKVSLDSLPVEVCYQSIR